MSYAPGDEYHVSHCPGIAWEVLSCWMESGPDYKLVEWLRLYSPTRGCVMVKPGDPDQVLYSCPRPIQQTNLPTR